jgi:hypothetical protein
MQDRDKRARGIIYITGTISRHVNKKLHPLVSDSPASSMTFGDPHASKSCACRVIKESLMLDVNRSKFRTFLT